MKRLRTPGSATATVPLSSNVVVTWMVSSVAVVVMDVDAPEGIRAGRRAELQELRHKSLVMELS
jgi:hypothetical protein